MIWENIIECGLGRCAASQEISQSEYHRNREQKLPVTSHFVTLKSDSFSSADMPPPKDHILRGVSGFDLAGASAFVIGRLISPVIIYFAVLKPAHAENFLFQQVVLAMIFVGALRHSFWVLFLHPHPFPVSTSLVVL